MQGSLLRFSDRSSYKLVVKATDGGGKESATNIQIDVINVNKPPVFKQDEYKATVKENSPQPSLLFNQVKATEK